MAMRHNDVPRMTRLALLVPATRHALIRAQVYGKIARKLASALRDFLTESAELTSLKPYSRTAFRVPYYVRFRTSNFQLAIRLYKTGVTVRLV
eukprot:1138321-Prymnesium_polylepis.1